MFLQHQIVSLMKADTIVRYMLTNISHTCLRRLLSYF